MRHLILLLKPLTADSINQGIKFIAMLKILFSMHAVDGHDTELSKVCDFYKDEISKMQLQAQLPLLQALFAEEEPVKAFN